MTDYKFKNCVDSSIHCMIDLFPDIKFDVLTDISILCEDSPDKNSIGWMVESPEIINQAALYLDFLSPWEGDAMTLLKKRLKSGNHNFKRLYTYDKSFEGLPNVVVIPYCPAPTWIEPENIKLHDKNKLCSVIVSNKKMTPFQVKRVRFSEELFWEKNVDCFGTAYSSGRIEKKSSALKEYCFSYCVENVVSPYYFTEKIVDCFLTGTVPIYAGDPMIGEIFDKRGIIDAYRDDKFCVVSDLSFDLYESMMPYIKKNFEIAKAIKNRPQDIFQQIFDNEMELSDD